MKKKILGIIVIYKEFFSYKSQRFKNRCNKKFVNIENGTVGGSLWKCFIIGENKSFCIDNFGIQPDKFLLNQLPKRIIYHNWKIQDTNSELSGSYYLYFFYLIEKMNY